MLVVIANVYLKENQDNEFINAAKPCIEGTRKEAGNISYNLNKNIGSENVYTFIEEWKSKEDLDLHMKTDHFVAFGSAIESILVKPLEVSIYSAEKL